MPIRVLPAVVLALAGLAGGAGVDASPDPALAERVDAGVRACRDGDALRLPLRSSGVDLVPLYANGYSLETADDSPFARRDLAVELFRENDLARRIEGYLTCDSPVLAGTQAQLQAAAALTEDDERTRMVVIYQHGWSVGADAVVARAGIDTLADLSGATIALEAFGPQIDLLAHVLAAARDKVDEDDWEQPELVHVERQLGFGESAPGGRFYTDDAIDAALLARPDADVLTSGGGTGTGAEGSIEGAHVLFSTRSASRAVSEVYAVRADYLEANREQLKTLVSALFRAEEQVREDVKKQIVDWDTVARHLLGDSGAVRDARTLWSGVETAGMQGNVDWAGETHPRSFRRINSELANALVPVGLLDRERSLQLAGYDYPALAEGVFDKRRVDLPSFDSDAAARMVAERRENDELDEQTIAEFEIRFEPNQTGFPISRYREDFADVVEAASTYGGAVFTVEGHADPLGYLRKKQQGADLNELRTIRQAAKNLSRNRAMAVRDAVVEFAEDDGVSMDPSQFVTDGLGFSDPRTGICNDDPCPPETEEQWRSNMRVVFRAVRVEGESSTFTPPNSW